jgi:hypothetical protein
MYNAVVENTAALSSVFVGQELAGDWYRPRLSGLNLHFSAIRLWLLARNHVKKFHENSDWHSHWLTTTNLSSSLCPFHYPELDLRDFGGAIYDMWKWIFRPTEDKSRTRCRNTLINFARDPNIVWAYFRSSQNSETLCTCALRTLVPYSVVIRP